MLGVEGFSLTFESHALLVGGGGSNSSGFCPFYGLFVLFFGGSVRIRPLYLCENLIVVVIIIIRFLLCNCISFFLLCFCLFIGANVAEY